MRMVWKWQRKKGETYFDTFVELVSYSPCRAADLLKERYCTISMRKCCLKNERNA